MRSLFPAAALAMVLLLAFPPVPADNDSLKVIVLAERGEYSIGTTVQLTVLVYDGGVPVDPDSTPEVTILSAAPRGVPVFKFDNGLFRGNFTIQPSDVVASIVPVEASATLGKSIDTDKTYNKDTDIASIYLSAPQPGALSVRLYTRSVSESVVRPGAAVAVAAEVTASGSPVQPDGFDLTASYVDPDGGGHPEPVNATSPQTGRFEATYALPQVPYDLHLTLTARASAGNLTATGTLSLAFNQFWVVYHNSTKTATGTTFYLYAGDPSGRALVGATFDFSYWPDGNASLSKKGSVAPTDQGGKSRFSLEFEAGTRTLTLEGRVNASGRSQRFGGIIDVSTASSVPRPSTGGFEMMYTGPGDLYTPGKEAQRQYMAFNNSQPLRNADIFTYIVAYPYTPGSPLSFTPVALLQGRPYTTDAQGRLTIPFTPPSYDCYLTFYFKNATAIHPKPSGYFFNHDSNDGQYYSETVDAVFVSRAFSGADVKVQVSPYKPGTPVQITATSGTGEPESAYAMWIPGAFDPAFPGGAPSGEWQVWEGIGSYLNRTAGGFSGSVTVPVFMPGEVRYTVVVFVTGRGSALPQYGSTILPKAATNGPTTEAFPLYLLIIIIIVAAVAAAGAGGLALRRRRARAAAPAGIQTTISCPACQTAFPVVQGSIPAKIQCPKCGKTGTLPALAAAAAQPVAAPAAPPAAAAAGPPPAAGVKVSIPCPSCGTVFDIVRGPAPTRIQCPNCGKSGMIGGLGGPGAAAPPPPAPTPAGPTAMQAQGAMDMPRPEPVVETRTIACPQCKNRFTIEKKEGPQQIRCPHCGKEGVIGRAPPGAAAPSGPAPIPAPAPAPQPYQPPAPQPVAPARRPAPAPRMPAGIYGQTQVQPAAQAPGAPAGRLITCPACRNRFPVSDPRRPIRVRCPACGKEGTLAR